MPESIESLVDQVTYALLVKTFGKAAAEAAALYIPAVRSMGLDELKAYIQLQTAGKTTEQLDALRALMTAEQLAEEKTKLADWTALLADQRAEQRALGNSLISAALRAALTAVLPVAVV